MIEVARVSRRYGRFEAVRDVSFHAKRGEVLGLLGQNGAGKTTIMNVLAGFLTPTSGSVRILEHDIEKNPDAAKVHLGYLPETPPLYPEMTVREYLLFCSNIKGVAGSDRARHVHEIIALCGLKEVENRVIANLSRGFKQRAGMAQALCGDPEVLLLDEPTTGFDPLQAVAFRKLIRKVSKEKAIVFSSHLLSEVQAICDRVVIIHHGKIMMDHSLIAESNQAPQFRVVIDAPAARVLAPLRELKSVRRVSVEPNLSAGTTKALLETEPGSAFQLELFTLLTGLRAPIMELTPRLDSLEELFLRVTGTTGEKPV